MNKKINDGLTKTQRWMKKNPILYRASRLRSGYIAQDRKTSRIGNELPSDYVTTLDVMRLITKKCAHFDECGTYGWRKIGLNRLDNSLPHIKSNIEPCCKKCNDRLAAEYHKELLSFPIGQIDKTTGEILHTWSSAAEAAEKLKYRQGHISHCVAGGYYDKSRGGKWHSALSYKGCLWKKIKREDD